MICLIALHWARSNARSETDAESAEIAHSHVELLSSELQKFRLLPLVLSEYPDAQGILENRSGDVAARLNGKLELLASRTEAAAIYVIGPGGRTLAASNWRLPASFVGQNFSFRPYFREALADGSAELFALGTVSGRPGLFIARRIGAAGRPQGVIVVKVEFDQLERRWARQPGPTFVADTHGVVIITSDPAWRFRSTRLLDTQTRDLFRASIQFGALPLDPLGLSTEAGGDVHAPSKKGEFRLASVDAALAGSKLTYLHPLAPARASAAATAGTVVLTLIIIAAISFAWFWRTRVRRIALIEAQRTLEGKVASRTAQLREANARLITESEQREAADLRFRAAREELAQANRLGSIGQITAGVAHEINQPVAAIRTFAENSTRLLQRGDTDRTGVNLTHIVQLADRIGRITAELRTFARRGTPAVGSVQLAAVIDGALLLTGDRIRQTGTYFEQSGDGGAINVVADKVRLEQVLINLIQNALDALGETPKPHILLRVSAGEVVTIDIADNGPGILPSIEGNLFTPFVTGKSDGLGLGLGIARDIMREFRGSLETIDSALGGAAFRMMLRRA